MTDGIEAITTKAVALALDAASLRHRAIATNVANVSTVGYVPQRVNFEAQLADARRNLRERGTLDNLTLDAVRLQIEPVIDSAGLPAKVQLDEEMAGMAQNTLQYQALIKALSRHMSVLTSAISEGKK